MIDYCLHWSLSDNRYRKAHYVIVINHWQIKSETRTNVSISFIVLIEYSSSCQQIKHRVWHFVKTRNHCRAERRSWRKHIRRDRCLRRWFEYFDCHQTRETRRERTRQHRCDKHRKRRRLLSCLSYTNEWRN